MAIDLSQFHQVFFEESFENVDIMETSLMELDLDEVDSETINAIFRAAHSIKGGSATFGFSAIASFTHILETLLDQIRGGERELTGDDVDLFLKSVDCLREMLDLLKTGEDSETELSREVSAKFSAKLEGNVVEAEAPATDSGDAESAAESAPAEIPCWHILFRPGRDVLKTGNDSLRLINELNELGEMKCSAKTDELPLLDKLEPEASYLYWEIELSTDAELSQIEEIFAWVIDESEVVIKASSPGAMEESTEVQAVSENATKEPEQNSNDDDIETFWSIDFVPGVEILRTGNDPLKIFQALTEIGKIKSITASSQFPEFSSIDPELCYLRWIVLLDAKDDDKEKIEKAFEWVKDDSELEVKSVSGLFTEELQKTSEQETTTEAAANTATTKAAAAKPKTAQKPKAPAKKANAESSSIRVGIDKVDNLINMVGELVITQSMLGQLGSDFDLERLPKLLEGLGQLEQNTRELQESVMRIRMLPISFVFSRFPRMVRDLSQSLNKDLNLEILGDQTELDKTVLEKIGDPLVHLVRNAVDHGVETPEERRQKGKPEQGNVTLNAYHQGGNVVIEVVDDGKGLDPESLKQKAIEKEVITASEAESLTNEQAFDLIFQPGFSTAKQISDVSGRGVGMDVVKRNIQALNGAIDITSEVNQGSTITIRLPLTLAILDGQLVRVGKETYIFPIVSIVESLQCKSEYINKVAGGSDVFRLRDEYVPILQLAKVFNIEVDNYDLEGSLMVVVESEGDKVGIIVDELLAQQQVVIKSLEHNYQRVEGISGATILGDGTVALIVDIPGIARLAEESSLLINAATQANVSNQNHLIQ
ncbi:chemotaxis protein CheA [Agarilytica rhodophyticola]|uniref:chemotaxis protein CheA n=1 Tax=Agarilytica rhodophyticola TaxID=1737490 RepID=UPI000B345283|nr:chemotaxis protein CheA [Agarilytica rhodophyticola]